jgi:hypothetical protein
MSSQNKKNKAKLTWNEKCQRLLISYKRKRTDMTTISIDNKSYDLDTLSDEAKAQLASIQFVDAELARLQAQAAALQTARIAYSNALQAALPTVTN